MKIVKIIAIVAAACGFMVSASCTCQQEAAAPVHVEAAK
jgi:hypothetical protein